MENVFDTYGRYYDLLNRDKNYIEEARYIERQLRAHGEGRDLLEFGCGTGKHARLLCEAGYRVLGVDRSAQMIAQAETSEGFSCVQGDVRSVQLSRTFDAVLALFHVVSYQTDNHSVCALMDRACEHLRPGGLFIFDVWYTPAVCAQRPSVRVKRFSGEGVDIVRIAEPEVYSNENRVDVHYTIAVKDRETGVTQDFAEVHPMRHFSLPEIDFFAERSGFERVVAEEFLSGRRAGEDTWGVCLVLRKS